MNDFYRRVQLLMQLADANERAEKAEADLAAALAAHSAQAQPPAEGVTNEMVERASRALCQSGKFETGQGTCALICMGELGNARQGGCPCKVRVHERLARLVLEAALAVQENPND